ncbi:hypothetical protein C8R47DRAFT_1145458 [Mycena vitilis]|nr:hypothetical protein C8R47DRAFT_1145458 [Mycena vitilis]
MAATISLVHIVRKASLSPLCSVALVFSTWLADNQAVPVILQQFPTSRAFSLGSLIRIFTRPGTPALPSGSVVEVRKILRHNPATKSRDPRFLVILLLLSRPPISSYCYRSAGPYLKPLPSTWWQFYNQLYFFGLRVVSECGIQP